MTNANVEKNNKKKNTKNESHTVVNKKISIGNKRVFTKTILTYGKDVTMSSEVLLRRKYVRQAVGRALYTLEQFTK